MYKIVQDQSGESVSTYVPVKSKNEKPLLTEAEQSKGWIENFRDALN